MWTYSRPIALRRARPLGLNQTRLTLRSPGRQLCTSPRRSVSTPGRVMPSKGTEPGAKWNSQVILRFTAYFLGFCAVGHAFTNYAFSGSFAYGISMLPTFSSFGNYLILSRKYRRGRGVVVGDIVSFRHPIREGEAAVKRIVGLEGDFVLLNTPGKSDAMLQVPKGHCWVVGDNLSHSRDSRMYGPLPLALITGKVIAKIDTNAWSLFSAGPFGTGFSWVENGLQDAPTDDD